LKTTSELSAKLSQIIADSKAPPSIEDNAQVIQLQKAAVQQDSNRSSITKAISLMNCLCSCHLENRNDGVKRYELIEETLPIASEQVIPQPQIEEPSSTPSTVEPSSTPSEVESLKAVQSVEHSPTPSTVESLKAVQSVSLQNSEQLSLSTSVPSQISQALSVAVESQISKILSAQASNASSGSIELSLDKLSESKICKKCGKLRTSWLLLGMDEAVSQKSEEIMNEAAVEKDDLISVQTEKSIETAKSKDFSVSMRALTSIDTTAAAVISEESVPGSVQSTDFQEDEPQPVESSTGAISKKALQAVQSSVTQRSASFGEEFEARDDFDKSFMTAFDSARASIKSDIDSMICHNECKVHCPKVKAEPPVEQERILTASDKLKREDVASIESMLSSLIPSEGKEQERVHKSVQIVEPVVEKKEKEKKEKEKKQKPEVPKIPKIPPKVILSLVDIDMQKETKLINEKGTQSPSIHPINLEASISEAAKFLNDPSSLQEVNEDGSVRNHVTI
jgi:hypothetical protein